MDEARVGAKTMRSLDEVRADLARLRETARERHLQIQQRRPDTSFAPTDYMDIPEPLPEPRRKAESDDFAATAFVDFGCPIPILGR